MDDVIDSVKEHWPWALAIFAGGYFLFFRGGSSGGNQVVYAGGGPGMSEASQLRMAEIQAATTAAALESQTQLGIAQMTKQMNIELGELDFVKSGMQSLSDTNDAFIAQNIAAYQTVEGVTQSAIDSAANVTTSGIQAGALTTAAFASTVSDLGVMVGNLGQALGGAIGNSAGAIQAAGDAGFGFDDLLSVASMYYTGGLV